jgi:hypothetical protein
MLIFTNIYSFVTDDFHLSGYIVFVNKIDDGWLMFLNKSLIMIILFCIKIASEQPHMNDGSINQLKIFSYRIPLTINKIYHFSRDNLNVCAFTFSEVKYNFNTRSDDAKTVVLDKSACD